MKSVWSLVLCNHFINALGSTIGSKFIKFLYDSKLGGVQAFLRTRLEFKIRKTNGRKKL